MFKSALLMIFLAAHIAFAQTTWKGLRFGMSEAEVRKQYPALLEKRAIRDKEFLLIDRHQKLGGQPASAKLFFDKGGNLKQVSLSMDPLAADINAMSAAGSTLAIIEVLNKQLFEEYGQAISKKGKCNLVAEDVFSRSVPIFTCESLWKSVGETVKFVWMVKRMRISTLAIVYKPL